MLVLFADVQYELRVLPICVLVAYSLRPSDAGGTKMLPRSSIQPSRDLIAYTANF